MLRTIGLPELMIVFFLFVIPVFIVLPFWQIFAKAGFPAPLSLLMLVPLVGIVVLFVVAFSEWPIYRRLGQVPPGMPAAPAHFCSHCGKPV